jgi:hypothetical protein
MLLVLRDILWLRKGYLTTLRSLTAHLSEESRQNNNEPDKAAQL